MELIELALFCVMVYPLVLFRSYLMSSKKETLKKVALESVAIIITFFIVFSLDEIMDHENQWIALLLGLCVFLGLYVVIDRRLKDNEDV